MARSKDRYAREKRIPGRFVALPANVLGSAQFASLSGHAVKLLLGLLYQYRGSNNGDLTAAWTVMRPLGWSSKATLWKALRELMAGGWIVLTRQGGRHAPSLYATTILAFDESPKLEMRSAEFPRGLWSRTPPLLKQNRCPIRCTNSRLIDPPAVPAKRDAILN